MVSWRSVTKMAGSVSINYRGKDPRIWIRTEQMSRIRNAVCGIPCMVVWDLRTFMFASLFSSLSLLYSSPSVYFISVLFLLDLDELLIPTLQCGYWYWVASSLAVVPSVFFLQARLLFPLFILQYILYCSSKPVYTINLRYISSPQFSFSMGWVQKVLTYVEYRAVSGVFQNIDPPPPSPPSECVLPPHQRRWGVHTRRAVRGVGGQYFGRRQRYRIGLLQYNLSTGGCMQFYRAETLGLGSPKSEDVAS